MKFFTASIPARLFAAFDLIDNSKLQTEQQKVYNRIIQSNFKNTRTNSTHIKIYSNESKLCEEVHSDVL